MYKIFIDLDGVLADFDKGVKDVTGKLPIDMFISRMWSILARTPDFYDTLPWMADGKELWDGVKNLTPTILTGLPRGRWAEPQKRSWCRRELGEHVDVVTCMTKEKAVKAKELCVNGEIPLIVDDRDRIRVDWESAGGIFIHHKSAEKSLSELHEMGII